MKTLLLINKIAFFTTLVLFLTIYLGMLAEIPLAIIQVISAIYLTVKTYYKSDYAKKHLSIYWIVTISDLGLLYLEQNHFQTANRSAEWFLMVIFPMSIATYFYIIMKKIVTEYQQTKES